MASCVLFAKGNYVFPEKSRELGRGLLHMNWCISE